MATPHVSRREFLRWSALLAGTATLAACAPKAPAGGGASQTPGPAGAPTLSKEPITLQHWQSDWGKDWNDPMIKLSDAWTKEVAPNVKMEWTFMPALGEKLAAAVAGGNAPDIATIDEGYGVPKMARVGGLTPLQEYYDRDGVKGSDFIGFTWETCIYKGVPYGIPGGAGAVVLILDKAIWKDAGIDTSALPDTPSWDQFVEWSQRLVKKDSNGKIVRIGANPDPWGFGQFAGILGATYYNADKTKLTLNSPETLAAVERWVALKPEGIAYEDVSNMLAGAPTSTYGSLGAGMQGIIWDGYWCFMALDKYWPTMDYAMTKLPTPSGSKDEWKLFTGWVWDPTIPKGSKHPNEAWSFMKYGYWDHGYMLADTLNWTSCLKSFDEFQKRTLNIMGESNRMKPYLHHFAEAQYGAGYFVPYTPIYNQVNDALSQAIDAAIRGQKNAKDGLDELVATLQPELDKVNAEG